LNSTAWRGQIAEGEPTVPEGTYTPTIGLIKPRVWVIESFTDCGKFYVVETEARNCTYPAHQYGLRPCKHVLTVEMVVKSLRKKFRVPFYRRRRG